MKKLLALLLVAILCFSLASCGGNVANNNLKDTVSTDIVDLTLEDSKLTYYVSNVHSTYVEPTEEPNTLYAAKTGTCYVSMTVTITNKDRGGSLDFGGTFGKWNPAEWTVKYNKKNYDMYGFDFNIPKYDYISLSNGALLDKDTGKVIQKIDTNNILISAGQTVTVRMFGIIHTDPESLNDGYELEVRLPNSEGKYESFAYEIPARA